MHLHWTVAGCFAVLRQIRSIRRSLPPTALQTLVVSLMLSRLDYGNSALLNIPAYILRRLPSVLNAAARSIAGLPRSAHMFYISLACLQWLRAAARVKFKLATLTYSCLHGTAPCYLSDLLRRLADVPTRRRLRSSSSDRVFPGRWCKTVERAFRRHHCCPIADRFPPSAQNVLVSSLISGFYLIPVCCSAFFSQSRLN